MMFGHRALAAGAIAVMLAAASGCSRSAVESAGSGSVTMIEVREVRASVSAARKEIAEARATSRRAREVRDAEIQTRVIPDWSEGGCVQRGGVGFLTGWEGAREVRRIGASALGRGIWAEHWGARSGPQVIVVAQVHGDECAGALVAQTVREAPPVTWGVWLIPTLNPDGMAAFTRRNAENVDLNRDGLAQRASETRALMAFTRETGAIMSVHVHSPLGWVGPHKGELARRAGEVLAGSAALRFNWNAGSGRGYLWEGQSALEGGHDSVLVELPAIVQGEAQAVFARGDGVRAGVEETRVMARGLLDGLKAVLGP